jgi:hypothetical protein
MDTPRGSASVAASFVMLRHRGGRGANSPLLDASLLEGEALDQPSPSRDAAAALRWERAGELTRRLIHGEAVGGGSGFSKLPRDRGALERDALLCAECCDFVRCGVDAARQWAAREQALYVCALGAHCIASRGCGGSPLSPRTPTTRTDTPPQEEPSNPLDWAFACDYDDSPLSPSPRAQSAAASAVPAAERAPLGAHRGAVRRPSPLLGAGSDTQPNVALSAVERERLNARLVAIRARRCAVDVAELRRIAALRAEVDAANAALWRLHGGATRAAGRLRRELDLRTVLCLQRQWRAARSAGHSSAQRP